MKSGTSDNYYISLVISGPGIAFSPKLRNNKTVIHRNHPKTLYIPFIEE
jgi:hypothetical protein